MSKHQLSILLSCLLLAVTVLHPVRSLADAASARLAMENPGNPLVEMTTALGAVYLELLPAEAPRNVANFLSLAAGEVPIVDRLTGQPSSPRYYDGMGFHRVIPGLLIQTGSPIKNVFGSPEASLPDEINADALGLNRMAAVRPDGSFNPLLQLQDREDLEESLLVPLYRSMQIESNQEVSERQYEIEQRLRSLTLKQAYENLGYRYTDRFLTRPLLRGTVALANRGPNSNGPEFFINVADATWLNGRYTVIGRVVEGMDVVDTINRIPKDSTDIGPGTLIYRIRQL